MSRSLSARQSFNSDSYEYAISHSAPCSAPPEGGGWGNSTYYVMRTCHFALKIGTHNSVNSGGF